MKFKKIIQRGQVLALYGVLIPLLFLFVGVGLDLGWYYLNVSRLQNAADAAALAGAFELTEKDKTMRDYFVDGLTTEPSGVRNDNYYSSFNIDTGETDENGNSIINKIDIAKKNGLSVSELQQSKTEALSYATQNLYDVTTDKHSTVSGTSKTINEWTNNKNVAFSATLFTRILDADREKLSDIASTGFRYYKVQLTEKIDHLFMPGWFDPMDATVVAWAVIKPRDLDLVKNLNDLSGYKTIQNVIYQDNTKYNPEAGYKGKWAHFQDEGVYYTAGDVNRKEVVNIHNDSRGTAAKSDRTQNTWTVGGGNDNGTNIDSLNLDFRVEYVFKGTYNGYDFNNRKNWNWDWDLRSDLPEGITRTAASAAKNWTSTDKAMDMRLITSFNFNYAWTDRNLNDLVPDVLWTHIESDPLWFEYGSSWNSVHQIVLNAHESNTAYTTINEQKVYTERPFVIFYDGPEVYNANSTVRVSQPVILNLYNDWNAILYMPNSPVIINGNGHKLTGFVVAKEFRRLKTAEDMEDEGYTKVTDMYGKKLFTKKLFTEAEVDELVTTDRMKKIDDKGNLKITGRIPVPRHLILSINREQFAEYGYSNLATFKVYGLSTYIAATYKEHFKKFRGITDDNLLTTVKFPTGAWTYVNTEEAYTVAKADLLTAPGTDSGVTYIKVIDTADNTEKYLDKDKLPYIKIRRNDLRPYVSVYDLGNKKNNGDGNYAGVTIQDDSLSATGNNTNSDVGLDSTNVKDHRSVKTNPFFDGTKEYQNYLDGETISVHEEHGYNYFMFKSDEKKYAEPKLIYEFRKVTDDEGNVFYIKEKEWTKDEAAYYMEVLPEGSYKTDANGDPVLDSDGNYVESNPIIVDNWGDLQSVLITPQEVQTVETETQNTVLEKEEDEKKEPSLKDSELSKYYNAYTRRTTESEDKISGYPVKEQPGDPGRTTDSGKYVGMNGNRVKELYKVPALERVYYPSAKVENREIGFNLSSDSCYSYFQIEELKRANYTYLNVDELNERVDSRNPNKDKDAWNVKDMFFTTKRGKWID